MKRVLVTGISGQDGSYLADSLLADGLEVHALVRERPAADEQAVDEHVIEHVGDLADETRLGAIVAEIEPDCVFNLGGISSVAESWQIPVQTARVTGVAAVALLEAAWRLQESSGRDVRFIQASSSEIFGAAAEVPQNEHTAIRPISPYGAAKALAHHAVSVYRKRGLFASSMILYNHESPRRPETFVTRKITRGVALIAAGQQERLSLGNLDARRDWGWAPDYVDALVRASCAESPDDFIVATGKSRTVGDFAAAAFRAAGISDWRQHVSIDQRFARPTDAPEMSGDASKARDVLGWAPSRPFDEMVAEMVEHDIRLVEESS